MTPNSARKSVEFEQADELARERGASVRTEGRATAVQLAWRSDHVSATRIGWRIAALDREVRRSATAADRRLPSPILPSIDEGGLEFREGAPGSTEILFDLYGFVRDVVLSDPIQIILRAAALAGGVGAVWGFFFRRDPLKRISGREALAVIREYEEARTPPPGAEPMGSPPQTSSGRTRVGILVENDDGTRVVVFVEMD